MNTPTVLSRTATTENNSSNTHANSNGASQDDAGAAGLFEKPYEADELLDAIKEILGE